MNFKEKGEEIFEYIESKEEVIHIFIIEDINEIEIRTKTINFGYLYITEQLELEIKGTKTRILKAKELKAIYELIEFLEKIGF